VRAAADAFTAVRWRWHPREANEAADALVRDLLWP
jgi:ribonuclease HI